MTDEGREDLEQMEIGTTYGEFAQVYDEFMDEAPYEIWCEQIDAYICKYGISRPIHRTEPDQSLWQTRQNQQSNQPQQNQQSNQPQQNQQSNQPQQNQPSNQPQQNQPSKQLQKIQPPKQPEQTQLLNQLDQNRLSNQPDQDNPLLQSERNLVVDLGCGTGTFTRLLAQKGYDIIGVDNSEEMLAIAAAKSREEGQEILFLRQDMRELDLYSTVGTVVSVCDSLNYMLTEEDLFRVFQLVRKYLYPGGIFIFDFNTLYKYERIIGDTVIAENREACSFIWENIFDPDSQCNEYDLTVFVREEDGRYRRFQETHHQRGYTVEEMVTLLQQAGFSILETMDADTLESVTAESERIYVVAKGSK
jgi:SAM-dependent methyltransferase